ncbi:MAG: class I SAM-dependent methyltransferase [Acidobacteriota bacterium]
MIEFNPHDVTWTREKSARFWNAMAGRQWPEDHYFSAAVGASLVRFVRSRGIDLSGRILDFGCGPGHLVRELLPFGSAVSGVDFSEQSIQQVIRQFEGQPGFAGGNVIRSVPTDLPDGSFETIFFVETIEHLLDGDLEATVGELRRLLSKGGSVVVSTPNDEDLQRSESICPDCGCTFHRMQHVRKWSASSLSSFMTGWGFKTVAVEALYLQGSWWKTLLFGGAARLLGKPLPHLVYIGRVE